MKVGEAVNRLIFIIEMYNLLGELTDVSTKAKALYSNCST